MAVCVRTDVVCVWRFYLYSSSLQQFLAYSRLNSSSGCNTSALHIEPRGNSSIAESARALISDAHFPFAHFLPSSQLSPNFPFAHFLQPPSSQPSPNFPFAHFLQPPSCSSSPPGPSDDNFEQPILLETAASSFVREDPGQLTHKIGRPVKTKGEDLKRLQSRRARYALLKANPNLKNSKPGRPRVSNPSRRTEQRRQNRLETADLVNTNKLLAAGHPDAGKILFETIKHPTGRKYFAGVASGVANIEATKAIVSNAKRLLTSKSDNKQKRRLAEKVSKPDAQRHFGGYGDVIAQSESASEKGF